MYKWHFNRHQPGYKTRDPIQSEFFTQDSVSAPGSALIREGIQNALDARISPDKKVTVRIFLSGGKEALTWKELDPFVPGLYPHISARRNGLDFPPTEIDTCPFLVFEDFETTGLTGDPHEGSFSKAQGNNFFNFLRAEGRSDKGEESIGRWGIGKSVFNLASRASSFFCLTVRSDDKARLLMGHAILKHHSIDGKDYVSDGYLGAPSDESEYLANPIDDDAFIELFAKTFQLIRDPNMSGLSVVVPWYNLVDINETTIVKYTLKDYFWSILQGKLEVWVQLHPKIDLILNAKSIFLELEKLEGQYKSDIIPLVDLAKWGIEHGDEKRIHLKQYDARRRPEWKPELFPENSLLELRNDLLESIPIALRIPVYVKFSDKHESLNSYFDIYLVKDDGNQDGRVNFIREGIAIPEVRHRRIKHYRCLVVVEDKPIATMLGDAENPAHTEWRKDTRGFKQKYKYAAGILDFVTSCPSEIVKLLVAEDEEIDRRILSDFFSVPTASEENEEEGITEPTTEPGSSTPGGLVVDIDIEVTPEGLRLGRVKGGFTLASLKGVDWQQQNIKIEAAYFTRKGNPFKAYHPVDFSFENDSIEVTITNARIASQRGNCLVVTPTDQKMKIEATGFDPNRDLKVKATLEEKKYDHKKIEFHGTQADQQG